jgi:hypothetical protein
MARRQFRPQEITHPADVVGHRLQRPRPAVIDEFVQWPNRHGGTT